jgi:hypothetical protein
MSESDYAIRGEQLKALHKVVRREVQKSFLELEGGEFAIYSNDYIPFRFGDKLGWHLKDRSTLRFSATKNYRKCLTSSLMEQVVLYGVSEARAWLVPLICVLHEMLVA